MGSPRFERATAQLGRDSGARFAEIAQDCGYYDQSHLNRDFREFAGSRELEDQDYGSRDYSARDPEGNIWSFGTYDPATAPAETGEGASAAS